jgi:hypothetical protein
MMGRGDLTLDDECTVDQPYEHCDSHHGQVFVPNSDPSSLQRKCSFGGHNYAGEGQKTYARSASKRDVAEKAT